MPQYRLRSAAVWQQFRIPGHSAISIVCSHSIKDLLVSLHANEFARLKIQIYGRSRLALWYTPQRPRKARPSPEWVEFVIEPAHRSPHSNARLAQTVVKPIN